MTAVEDTILYVDQNTLSRLISSERARLSSVNGVVTTVFTDNDHKYPGTTILVSREVLGNAVHRKVWVAQEQRFIFEYVGDV